MIGQFGKPLPVGQRPNCLSCERELRPNFHTDPTPGLFYTWPKPERLKWKREHTQFTGTYGGYDDNRFCGLNCGYRWARKHTKDPLGTAKW